MVLAIKYLHEKHIIHRDLKTNNLLLMENDDLIVADFGASKQLDNTQSYCNTFCGTYSYLAPEVVKGRPYTYATDMWAMGLVLYEMAASKHLFQINMQYDIALYHAITTYPIPLVPQNVNRLIHAVFTRLLNRTPNKRPGAQELFNMIWISEKAGDLSVERTKAGLKSLEEWLDPKPAKKEVGDEILYSSLNYATRAWHDAKITAVHHDGTINIEWTAEGDKIKVVRMPVTAQQYLIRPKSPRAKSGNPRSKSSVKF